MSHDVVTGWVVVMGGGDLLQLQLAPRHTKLGIKAIPIAWIIGKQ